VYIINYDGMPIITQYVRRRRNFFLHAIHHLLRHFLHLHHTHGEAARGASGCRYTQHRYKSPRDLCAFTGRCLALHLESESSAGNFLRTPGYLYHRESDALQH